MTMRREKREGSVKRFDSLEHGRKIGKIKDWNIYICKLFTDVRLSSCVSVAWLYMHAAAALASVPLLSVI